MNGAEALIQTAVDSGVDVCFANPGTTEMPLVAAMDTVAGMRAVLGLFEGVCSGAADGFGRMAGRPALTLTHLGPGFANGIANLHNARRARTPVVNIIGDQATWHLAADAPLTSDIESLARPVSRWVRSTRSAKEVADDTAQAVAEARRHPGGVATLIVPSDCQWEESPGSAGAIAVDGPPPVDNKAVDAAARFLREHEGSMILLGAAGLSDAGLVAAGRVAAATRAKLACETFASRIERGRPYPAVPKLAYFPEQAQAEIEQSAGLLLAGALEPVAFFGYPDSPSRLVPDGYPWATLASPSDDVAGSLAALAEALGAGGGPTGGAVAAEPVERPTGKLSAGSVGAAIAALVPEGGIVMDESATSGGGFFPLSAGAAPFTCLGLTGGAIGQGLPAALGAAVACPDRPVIAFQADGSGMYTVQSLWSMAREGVNVTVLLCSNRSYRILQIELARAGVAPPGPQALALTDLSNPVIDWVKLAEGIGVPAAHVESVDGLVSELETSLTEAGPRLIEVPL